MPPPIDGEVHSSDEAGSVGRQEGDALGHLLHFPWPTERMGLLTPRKELVVKKNTGYRKFEYA